MDEVIGPSELCVLPLHIDYTGIHLSLSQEVPFFDLGKMELAREFLLLSSGERGCLVTNGNQLYRILQTADHVHKECILLFSLAKTYFCQ